jgi:hypothetical protein
VQFGGGDVLLAGVVQCGVGSSGSRIEGDDVFAGVTMHTPQVSIVMLIRVWPNVLLTTATGTSDRNASVA